MVLVLNNFIGGEFVGSHNDNNNNDEKNNIIERFVLVLCFKSNRKPSYLSLCNAFAAQIQLLEKFLPFYQTPLQKMLR